MVLKKIILIFSLFVLSLLSSGCASIIHSSTQELKITSNVKGAEIYINGKLYGKTPKRIKFERSDSFLIEVKLIRYETYRIQTQKSLNNWFWGNLISLGVISGIQSYHDKSLNISIGGIVCLIGMAFDVILGTSYNIEPDHIDAILKKSDTSYFPPKEIDKYNLFIQGYY